MQPEKILVSSQLPIMPCLRQRFPQLEFKQLDCGNISEEGRHLVLLEAAKGLEEPAVITDWDEVGPSSIMSGSDLPVTLKMLVKLGAVGSAVLIRLPSEYPEERALEESSTIISGLFSD